MINVITIAVTLNDAMAAKPNSRTVLSLTPRALPENWALYTLNSASASGNAVAP